VGPPLVDVEDRELLRAQGQQRVRDGGAGAARAEQDHGGQWGVGQSPVEGTGETRPVGVVADRAPVPQDHGVDRAEGGGVGGELVEVVEDELLAGMGDVEAVVAGEPRGVEDLADGARGAVELGQVQAAVEIADPELVGLPLVHRRGQRRADPAADESDEETGGAGAHKGLPGMYQLVS
jgi:hypothetical protein